MSNINLCQWWSWRSKIHSKDLVKQRKYFGIIPRKTASHWIYFRNMNISKNWAVVKNTAPPHAHLPENFPCSLSRQPAIGQPVVNPNEADYLRLSRHQWPANITSALNTFSFHNCISWLHIWWWYEIMYTIPKRQQRVRRLISCPCRAPNEPQAKITSVSTY